VPHKQTSRYGTTASSAASIIDAAAAPPDVQSRFHLPGCDIGRSMQALWSLQVRVLPSPPFCSFASGAYPCVECKLPLVIMLYAGHLGRWPSVETVALRRRLVTRQKLHVVCMGKRCVYWGQIMIVLSDNKSTPPRGNAHVARRPGDMRMLHAAQGKCACWSPNLLSRGHTQERDVVRGEL
jgi:hypothetical protein